MIILKKIAAILLIGILLFNWIGYRLFTSYLENQSDSRLEAQLDNNNYDENQLMSIKFPVPSLSYYSNSALYERVNGQIEIGGIEYKYVKRRLYNDSLELLCIPNFVAMKLQLAKDDYFKLINDLQHNGQNKKSGPHTNASKNLSGDYYAANELVQLNDLCLTVIKRSFHFLAINYFHFSSVIENPPEHC